MSTTWINRGHFYVPHVTPVMVDCNFVVDATNGLGITNLKGQGVQNVFMHTSTTPGTGNNGFVNPNPAAGLIMVQLSDNFSRYYGGFNQIHAPVTGSDLSVRSADTALTVGQVYQITVLGGATAANWLALGVPKGVTPAVGVGFVALATGAGTDSVSKVKAIGSSGIDAIEIAGSPNLALSPIPVGGSPNVGGWLIFKCLAPTAALTMNSYTPAGTNDGATPPIFTGTPAVLTGSVAMSRTLTAPAASSVIRMAFYMSQSSVVVAGE